MISPNLTPEEWLASACAAELAKLIAERDGLKAELVVVTTELAALRTEANELADRSVDKAAAEALLTAERDRADAAERGCKALRLELEDTRRLYEAASAEREMLEQAVVVLAELVQRWKGDEREP